MTYVADIFTNLNCILIPNLGFQQDDRAWFELSQLLLSLFTADLKWIACVYQVGMQNAMSVKTAFRTCSSCLCVVFFLFFFWFDLNHMCDI